ncbi:MAG: hypothetical protein ACNA8P_05090 [Phycisphaerales bacterium]
MAISVNSDRPRRVRRSMLGGGAVTAYSRHRVWYFFLVIPMGALWWVAFIADVSPQTGFIVFLSAMGSMVVSTAIAYHLQSLMKRARLRDYRQCPFCVADLTQEAPAGLCPGCGAQYTFDGLRGYWLDCQERYCVRPDKISLERHGLGFDVRETSLFDIGRDAAGYSRES